MLIFKLPENLRKELKNPFGEITSFDDISGNPRKINDRIVICVGDRTCELAIKYGINAKIYVYDSLNRRKKIKLPDAIKNLNADEITIKNPAGHLSQESFDAIARAIESENCVKIIVDGEEDLITLAAIDAAPKGAIVMYGQPNEGVVVVEVDGKVKAKVRDIIDKMEKTQ